MNTSLLTEKGRGAWCVLLYHLAPGGAGQTGRVQIESRKETSPLCSLTVLFTPVSHTGPPMAQWGWRIQPPRRGKGHIGTFAKSPFLGLSAKTLFFLCVFLPGSAYCPIRLKAQSNKHLRQRLPTSVNESQLAVWTKVHLSTLSEACEPQPQSSVFSSRLNGTKRERRATVINWDPRCTSTSSLHYLVAVSCNTMQRHITAFIHKPKMSTSSNRADTNKQKNKHLQ